MKKFPFEKIIDWYEKNWRHSLPWRQFFHLNEKERAYHVWLSEIILQQTQVERGILYYENLLKKFPTIESLANTSYEDFFPFYKGLWYYSRAKNMLKTAQIITEKYAGNFPKETENLTKLPGIGEYTAEAIRAFAFDIKTLSFDTNLLKIFARYYYGDRFHLLTKAELENIKEQFLSTNMSGRDINGAMMDFASIVSLNNKKAISWENYPLKSCLFYETKWEKESEQKKKQESFDLKNAFVQVVIHENHKIYFSENKEKYSPFLLDPSPITDIRKYIQEYFQKKYNLELSVRPISKKWQEWTKKFVLCNAQIQTGKNLFYKYDKKEI
jgi:A/G-specific adenine glycosylase